MMHRRSRLLFMVALLVAATAVFAVTASAQEPVTGRFKMSIGGYIKPEIMYRTNAASAGVAGNPFGVSNFGFATVPQANTTAGANGTFSQTVNETRIGITINAPSWRGLTPLGYIETDFAGNDSVIFSYCQTGGASPCAVTQNGTGSPQTSGFGYGGFRLRHAFFRLSGEGLGGSYNMTFGQTWGIMGMLPYYGNSTLDFGGGSVWGQRQPQLSFEHTLNLPANFQWVNKVGLLADTTFMNEGPQAALSSRFVWNGWQGWQGGTRTPLNFGISAMVQREKAQEEAPAGITNGPVRALSARSWGLTGGYFFPILPGTSATDRTWALSVVGEGGYGEGMSGQISGANPLPGAVLAGANNLATPGAVYFKPSSCSNATGAAGFPGVNPVGVATGVAATALAGQAGACPAGQMATELGLVKSSWTSWGVQFYLPWGFWVTGGQKYLWFSNADNAVAQTCNTLSAASTACSLSTPVGQGNFNPQFAGGVGNAAAAAGSPICLSGSCVALNTTRDGLIKRMTFSYVTLFYDMTPNIRFGFEWGLHETNRKNSGQDNQSNRWQFGAYYFF